MVGTLGDKMEVISFEEVGRKFHVNPIDPVSLDKGFV